MKKSGVIAILSVATAALLAANGAIYITTDRTGPEIQFPNTEMSYAEGEPESELLNGVTATDNRDGDVTSSLRVSSVIPNSDNTEVTVEYTAKDSSNNVTKVSKTIPYGDGTSVSSDSASADEQNAAEDGTVSANETEQNTVDNTQTAADGNADAGNEQTGDADTAAAPQSTAAQTETPAEDTTENAAAASDAAAVAALPAGSPQITLTTHAVSISRGTAFNYMSYIASMTDDKDNASALARRIELNGSVDTNTAGTYTVTYVIRDTDGNISNQPSLTVTVQ